MADAVMVELVRDELRRRSDTGGLASRAELREAVGVGASDLEAVLDALRELGEASEVEPDGFSCGVQEPAPTGGAALDEEPEPMPPAERVRVAEFAGGFDAQVMMPRAVANVLDAEALGKLLKAGIDTTPAEETFTFEVTP